MDSLKRKRHPSLTSNAIQKKTKAEAPRKVKDEISTDSIVNSSIDHLLSRPSVIYNPAEDDISLTIRLHR